MQYTAEQLEELYHKARSCTGMSLGELSGVCLVASLLDKVRSHDPQAIQTMADTVGADLSTIQEPQGSESYNLKAACQIMARRS
jgi:hypothetical protein